MTDLATELATRRLAVAAARAGREVALRALHTAEAAADFWREPNGSLPVIDPTVPGNQEVFEAVQALEPALDAASAGLGAATAAYDQSAMAYDELAIQSPLFAAACTDPVLLLPLRLEAVYRDRDSETCLCIRVYPDDVHVDDHEPELTERERSAGTDYWCAVLDAEDDAVLRGMAWQALVKASGGARAAWVRRALTPAGPPGAPVFPEVDVRPEAWSRAARTLLLPDRLEFTAYRDGAPVWRRAGADIPDALTVGPAPRLDGDAADTHALPFDEASRWLVDFDEAVRVGMGLVVPLNDPTERYDLLTVVGVGTQDRATGAARVQQMLAAHKFSRGLASLPVRTPTNNTPGSRSGWRSRAEPAEPDVTEKWQAAYDASSREDSSRLARSLGVDGRAVLADVCDPADGDEELLRRLHRLQADTYASSPAWHPASRVSPEPPDPPPWYAAAADHYVEFVRGRGPLPALRIGRQPYGVLPVSSIDLWRENDADVPIGWHVGSFHAALAEHATAAVQVGEGVDQDAVLLDLLSRRASPGEVVTRFDYSVDVRRDGGPPPPASVGSIPSTLTLAWLHGDPAESAEGIGPFPETFPDELHQFLETRPLAQLLVVIDEALTQMRGTLVPPDPPTFDAAFSIIQSLWQLDSVPTVSLFYGAASQLCNWAGNLVRSGPATPEQVAVRVASADRPRNLLARFVALEEEAVADLPRLERLLRETLEPLSSRVDAWVTSLATQRLSTLRTHHPDGVRTGGYGWLTDVNRVDPTPSREGYVVTPSLHHATTAAVLRSGWQAHSDKGALAVDIQSTRVRRAQAAIDGVRAGQTMSALLGYQFERALHDAHLDLMVEGFRRAYPLAPLVEPDAEGAAEARLAIGARNVVDGQALRLDRHRLDEDQALVAAAGVPLPDGSPVVLRRILSELTETFDAVGDLLLAESVHQLVGGSALRAGLAADGIGRGQELPTEYDVLRTPRSGTAVTHHVVLRLPDKPPPGWTDDRPLARLEPGLEGWARHRLGPASAWQSVGSLGALGWSALDLLIAPADWLHAELTAQGPVDETSLTRLMLVCERLRAALAGAVPLNVAHLDPADPLPVAGCDLVDLHGRVVPWLAEVRAAASELGELGSATDAEQGVRRLAALGVVAGAGEPAGNAERLRAALAEVDLTDPGPPPDPTAEPAAADRWLTALLSVTADLLHPALTVVPRLSRDVPPPPEPAPEAEAVTDWLRDMALVRPRIEALDTAAVTSEVLADTAPSALAVAQPAAAPRGAVPWLATAPTAEGTRPRTSLVLLQDGEFTSVQGLVVDTWAEVVPGAPGTHGPEEVAGVAFDFDRPGARAPQALLIAVPPDPLRGWCMEDLHACVEETLLLSRLRTLDLVDVPQLRPVLPLPNGRS